MKMNSYFTRLFKVTVNTTVNAGFNVAVAATALIASALMLISPPARAYNEVLDTGEVLARGQYKLTGAAQVLTERGGANLTGIFDTGFNEDFGVRATVGFGKTDYFFGGMVKWAPIPDVDRQPAVSLNLGLDYARWMDASDLTFRAEPILSKKIDLNGAFVTPYVSLPLGLRTRNSNTIPDSTQVTMQLVGGSQLQVERWKNLQFIAEVGLNLDHTFSYISAGALIYLDNEKGFVLE